MLLLPFLPHLVSGEVPDGINIYVLYLLNLGSTVLSYWLFAYKNSLLQAHQRIDVTSKITLITSSFQYIIQLAVLFIWKNYYYYLMVALLTQALTNILTALIVTKMFPEYAPIGTLEKGQVREINRRVRDLFTSKLGSVIVNCTDSIVISSFLGLTILAVYNNYFFILSSVIGFVTIIFSACFAGIGNSIIVETEEKNYIDLKKLTFLISWIAGFCTCCFLCLYQPFMKLWVGDQYSFRFSVVICFCIYYFVYEINQLLNLYKDAAGIWSVDKLRPLASALTNLALNLILIRYIGIYAILLSTVISMLCVGMPWLLFNLFTIVFKRSAFSYILQLFQYVIITAIVCAITYGCCSLIRGDSVGIFLVKMLICGAIPNVLFLFIYYRREEFHQLMTLVDVMTKGRFALLQRFKVNFREADVVTMESKDKKTA
jgi:O-antigen/teichoic acid export membrane protein